MYNVEFKPNLEKLDNFWPNNPPVLFNVSPSKYEQLRVQISKDKPFDVALREIKKRMPETEYACLRASLNVLYKYSRTTFPAFAFLVKEFINEEWLSLVDFHKSFHRDHIYHQPQVAFIVKRLLNEVTFENMKEHKLVNECKEKLKFPLDYKITLLDLCAYQLAKKTKETKYMHEFAQDIGVNEKFLSFEQNPEDCHFFWKTVVYDSAIIAAFYHDIGYPYQFIARIEEALNPLTHFDLLTVYNPYQVLEKFENRLFIKALCGYKDFKNYPVPYMHKEDLIETIKASMKKTHGFLGAITYLYLNDYMRDYQNKNENPVGILKMEMAATAIMMHDMQKVYRDIKKNNNNNNTYYLTTVERPQIRLSFLKDPVSFVVTLADQLQDFGRTSSKANTNSKQNRSGKDSIPDIILGIEKNVKGVKFNIDNEYNATITYMYGENKADCYMQNEKYIPKLMSEYYNKYDGYLDYTGVFENIKLEATP